MLKEIIIESNFATITFRTDGIIHIHYSDHSFTLDETKALFLTIRKNSPWEVSPFYITGDSFTSQDDESKKFNTRGY